MIADLNDKCLYHWLLDVVIEWLNDIICNDEGIAWLTRRNMFFRFEEIHELPPCVVCVVAMLPKYLRLGDSSLYCKGRWENLERRCVAGFVPKMWCIFHLNLGPSMRHVSSSRTMGCSKNHPSEFKKAFCMGLNMSLSSQLHWIHLALSKLHIQNFASMNWIFENLKTQNRTTISLINLQNTLAAFVETNQWGGSKNPDFCVFLSLPGMSSRIKNLGLKLHDMLLTEIVMFHHKSSHFLPSRWN